MLIAVTKAGFLSCCEMLLDVSGRYQLRRTILHIALGLLLWIVFGYYWSIVVQRPITEQTRIALIIVGTLVGVLSLLSVWWIAHNKAIARRSERRRDRRPGVMPPPADFLGRTFVAQNEDDLRRARYVEIHLVQVSDDSAPGHKIFRVTNSLPETP